ncbi:hypothetical protein BDY19DRAFT_988973 [Irpex rosettiformis]|uniref:Uncharacterized protein n=1 Tax=Irpex rosettiformis TaxID=378272 RepID=A0ACB8ULK4_9APHY|nr:hypothetical protein BDY19DRAFT_988973 [Irpex rosettiformis]
MYQCLYGHQIQTVTVVDHVLKGLDTPVSLTIKICEPWDVFTDFLSRLRTRIVNGGPIALVFFPDTARKAIDAFAYEYGLKCCLVGGAACQLYGATRTPSDVDLVVLTTAYDQERLKALLVERDTTFYLSPAKTFGATYKVLWARLGYSFLPCDSCKVDVLIPGIMNIPDVPNQRIVTIDRFPVMPIIPLLSSRLGQVIAPP